MVRPFTAVVAVAALLPIAIASGCGSGSSSSTGSTTPATTAAATTTADTTATTAPSTTTTAGASGSAVAVEADPGGALAFVQKSLTAPAGKVVFTFTNASPLPHNLTFENAGTEHEAGATKTITSGSTSVTITLAPGKYNYYCSVPGHEAAGMKGTLTVT